MFICKLPRVIMDLGGLKIKITNNEIRLDSQTTFKAKPITSGEISEISRPISTTTNSLCLKEIPTHPEKKRGKQKSF